MADTQGFGWGFRHGWSHDFAIFPECGGSLDAPAPRTAMVCYGGQGYYTSGHGIQYSIDQGSLVQPLINAGVPASVPVYELCGSFPTMPLLHNEHTGPSDGAVFIAGCAATDGIANRSRSPSA